MSEVNCPYCNAANDAPDVGDRVQVTCSSCGRNFVAEFEPDTRRATSRRPASNYSRIQESVDYAAESWGMVLKGAGVLVVVALVLFLVYMFSELAAFLWLGIVAASLFPLWFMLWVMAFVRAIAKNTSR